MKSLLSFFFISIFNFALSQGKITINGKIGLLSSAKKIVISAGGGNFTADINADGSFLIQGEISEYGVGLIKTDSSVSSAIWMEPGTYNIVCKEIKIAGSNAFYFRTPELHGPVDAELYHGYNEPQYYMPGNSKAEITKNRKDFDIKYIDSVFANYPDCKALPEILRFSRGVIGDELTQVYISYLNKKQKSGDDFSRLEIYFKRKEKIEKEIFFQNFQMKDNKGKVFQLARLDKKLILLDFWSSDCMPCRRKHPKLAELYKKYSDLGFEIISISLDEDEDEWKKAIQKDGMSWINVSELKGWNTKLAEDYYVKSIPFSIWLDKDKKIVSIYDLSEKQIEEYLK